MSGQLAQIGPGIDGHGAELPGAEINASAVEVAGGDPGVAVVGAEPAQHPAVAAGQVEDVGVVGLVAELAGEMNQFQGPPAEVEILPGQRGIRILGQHAVAGRQGAVNREGGEIIERFHAASGRIKAR